MPPSSAQYQGYPMVPPEPEKKKKRRLPLLIVLFAVIALVVGALGGALGSNLAHNKSSSLGYVPSDNVLEEPIDKDVKAPPAPEGSVQAVAEKVLPSVVSIQVAFSSNEGGSGSGVVLSKDGLILTNAHVVNNARKMAVVTNNNRMYAAKLVGIDVLSDIAVVKTEGVRDMQPIEMGNSQNLAVGQEVVAVGAPLGLTGTVTSGIISALNRPVHTSTRGGRAPGGQDTVMNAIQTDAAINPGNSGGALVDMEGRLIGVNSAIASLGGENPYMGEVSGGNIGLGFAIPVNQARRIASELVKDGKASHSVIGVQVTPSTNPLGSLIAEVTAGSPADRAGLRTGEVITKVDGRPLDPVDGLVAYVRSKAPGDVIKVTVEKQGGGGTRTVGVTVGSLD